MRLGRTNVVVLGRKLKHSRVKWDAMCDEWMPALQLPLTWEQFLQLPRNAGYKYEYLEGKALLSPRPRHYHALLDLHAFRPAVDEAPQEMELRPMRADDFLLLEPAFKAAFHRIQPFG